MTDFASATKYYVCPPVRRLSITATHIAPAAAAAATRLRGRSDTGEYNKNF